jgi:hypothetical protein
MISYRAAIIMALVSALLYNSDGYNSMKTITTYIFISCVDNRALRDNLGVKIYYEDILLPSRGEAMNLARQ